MLLYVFMTLLPLRENTSTPEGLVSPYLKGCLYSTSVGFFSWPLVLNTLIKQHTISLPEDALSK